MLGNVYEYRRKDDIMMKKKLEIYAHVSRVVNDAYDRIITELFLLKEKSGFSSLAICGVDPKVGSTSIAINIAIAMAQAGWKTALVDYDLRKGLEYKHLSDGFEFGVVDYLSGRCDRDNIIYDSTQENLYFVPSGEVLENPIALLCSPKMNSLMKDLKEKFDFIIVDSPALSATADTNVVASRVDGAVLVVEYNETYKNQLQNSYETLEAVGANILGVVMNKADVEAYREYMRNYDYFNRRKYTKKRGGKK